LRSCDAGSLHAFLKIPKNSKVNFVEPH